jgi:hypothetical protein
VAIDESRVQALQCLVSAHLRNHSGDLQLSLDAWNAQALTQDMLTDLDNVLTLEPDEPEQDPLLPVRSAVQQVAVFGLAFQQPAAALGGGFELGHQQPRVVGPERHPFDLDLFRRGDVQQLAAQLANLLEPPQADLLGPLPRGLVDPVGQVGRLDALGALGKCGHSEYRQL